MSRTVKKSCIDKLLTFCETEVGCKNPVFASSLIYLQKKSCGEFGRLLRAIRGDAEPFFAETLFRRQYFSDDAQRCWNEEFCSNERFGDTQVGDEIFTSFPRMSAQTSSNLATIVTELDHREIVAEDVVFAYEYFSEKEARAKDGSFYTDDKISNLLLRPLFLDELRRNLAISDDSKQEALRKLSSWRFLDPACGCGSILISVKRSLALLLGEFGISLSKMATVEVVGFEIDKIAGSCAELALRVLDLEFGFESLSHGFVGCGNATKDDWVEVFKPVNFIVGNPPFLGGSKLSESQSADVRRCWGHLYKPDMDYVTCWLKIASTYVERFPETKVAFVTTNSVTQGAHLSSVWPDLLGTIRLTFAYESFRWDASMLVNVVILGFESRKSTSIYAPVLYEAKEVNAASKNFERRELRIELAPHLQPNVPFVDLSKRVTNISAKAPNIYAGAQIQDTKDTQGFTLTKKDVDKLRTTSNSHPLWHIRPQVAAKEILSGEEIYYLDLQQAAKVPEAFAERVKHIEQHRRASSNRDAARLAATPHLWGAQFTICDGKIIAIPAVSSKNYGIFPVILVDPFAYSYKSHYAVCNSTVYYVDNGTLFNFGVLQSSMHRAWIRGLCGTNGESTRYNAQLYKSFVWPTQNESAIESVKNAAAAIVDYRENSIKHSSETDDDDDNRKTLTDMHALYCGEMNAPLAGLHKNLDDAVEAMYGAQKPFDDDLQRLAFLIDLYNKEIAKELGTKKRQSSITEMFRKKPAPSKNE